jgi:hypothetical protein
LSEWTDGRQAQVTAAVYVHADMRKVVLALVAALTALFAVPALAADGTLSSASPSYKWTGGPMNGAGSNDVSLPVAGFGAARCSPAYECDNELVEIKETGGLVVDIKAGSGSTDLDVRLYKSDESGTAPGVQNPAGDAAPEPIAQDIRTEKDARISVKNLKPGFYVIQVAFFSATQGVYDGTAAFTAPPPPAAAPPAAPAPAAPAAPVQTSPTPAQNKADDAKRKKALAACNKKAKKIKNAKKRKAALKKCAKKYAKKKA